MDRRGVGAVVLVLAVVAALAGTSRTKELAGESERAAIPGPPQVGDCVNETWHTRGYVNASGDPYPAPAMGPCAVQRFGEVVLILADGLDYLAPVKSTTPQPADPFYRCSEAVDRYFGAAGSQLMQVGPWTPMVQAGPTLVGPNAMQRADGQRWLACAAVNFSMNGDGEYEGSLTGVRRTLKVPSALASCLRRIPLPDGANDPTDCAYRHTAEEFGTMGPVGDVPDEAGRQSSCADLAADLTGMPDPTAGGRLRVQVTDAQMDGYFGDGGSATWYQCLLVATGSGQLTGPLLGVGDGPLPLG